MPFHNSRRSRAGRFERQAEIVRRIFTPRGRPATTVAYRVSGVGTLVDMVQPGPDPDNYPPIDPREPVPDDPGELSPDTPETLPPAPVEPMPGPDDPGNVPEPA